MLVLVFIFMAPTVIDVDLRQPVVDLPKVEHPIPMWKANREDAIVFVVQRNGDLYFGNQILPQVDDVPFIITKAVHNGAEKKVYIRADAHAKYACVHELLESVHSAGIENVAFLADERKPF